MKISNPYFIKLLVLFLVYFLTGKFGLSVNAVSGFASLIWFPTGIALASLLIFGVRLWPAIFLGAFTINFLQGATLPASLAIGMGNTLEALAGIYLLRKFGFDPAFRKLNDALLLIFMGAMLSTLISASIGIFSLYYFSGVISSSQEVINTFFAWWVGDMLSDLVITPLILAYAIRNNFKPNRFKPAKIFELFALYALTVITSLIVFGREFGIISRNMPIAYLVPPFIIWAVLSFSLRNVMNIVALISGIAIWGILNGNGPFVVGPLWQNLLILQGFIGVWTAVALILASIIAERRELEERKDDFISLASHELKTPVTSLKLYAQLLQKDSNKPKSRRSQINLFPKFNTQIDKLDLLVSDLLDISKINLNRLEFRKENFDLNELVKETVKIIKPELKGHQVQISGRIKNDVFADRFRIGQVITNLLTNAAKYSPDAKQIRVTLKDVKNFVSVSVKDHGMGINLDQQKKIFERFYRVRDNIESTFPGLGIGLYVSAVIVKKHNGDITVVSTPGKGSTFSFTLPKKSGKDL